MKWQSWGLMWLTHVLCWPLFWNNTTTKTWELSQKKFTFCVFLKIPKIWQNGAHIWRELRQVRQAALKFGNHPSPLPASICPLHTLTSCLPFRQLNFWHLIISEQRFRELKQRKWLKYCEMYNGLILCVTEHAGHLPPLPSTSFLRPEQEVPDPLGLCLSCR